MEVPIKWPIVKTNSPIYPDAIVHMNPVPEKESAVNA